MPSSHAKALARAAELLGGVAALSDFLKVPQYELLRWIRGEEPPSAGAFLEVVELLSDKNPKAFAASRQQRPKSPNS